MTDTDALEKALALCKHLGIRGDDWDLRQVAAALKRAYAAALLAGHQMRGLQAIHEQHRIQKEADKLEGKSAQVMTPKS